MVWACDAKGGDPHNKMHTKYEGDGNKTKRTSKDEMARSTEVTCAFMALTQR